MIRVHGYAVTVGYTIILSGLISNGLLISKSYNQYIAFPTRLTKNKIDATDAEAEPGTAMPMQELVRQTTAREAVVCALDSEAVRQAVGSILGNEAVY